MSGAEYLPGVAESGDALAQAYLGMMYDYGRGVEASPELAVKWYTLAAVQGNAFAQYRLGTKYESGEGVARDYGELHWYGQRRSRATPSRKPAWRGSTKKA
ncbi:MAG: tetratricopeptide repeat protein [Bryobacterales bacterium]